jgi:hypothetical protein
MLLFRPIKKRESRPRGKPARKIAAFLPIPLTAAGQHIATENLPTALQKIKGKIKPEGLTPLVAVNHFRPMILHRAWVAAAPKL